MFSVVMAAYNAEKYLRESVESILNQTFPDFELLIVNDGSTDGTLAIAEEYAAKDARVRVIDKERNSGIADTTNRGLKDARFDWIAILDSDDLALPNRLEKQAEAIKQNPEVIAWAAYSNYINDVGNLLYVSTLGPTTEAEFQELRQQGKPVEFAHPTFTYRRDIALKIGGYNTEITTCDLELMDRMSDHGVMLTIPEPLVNYRVHTGSTTFTKFFRQEYEIRYIYERRAAQHEGKTLSFADYKTLQENKSSATKFREKLQGYGRLYWYYAGLAMGERKMVPFAKNLALSLACTPVWTTGRIVRQMRERLA